MMRPIFLALMALAATFVTSSCNRKDAEEVRRDNAPERARFYEDYNAKVLEKLTARKAGLEEELAGTLDDTSRKMKLQELDDVTRHLQQPEYFVFREEKDLPQGLEWRDGLGEPEIGSPDARKGGTFHGFIQGNSFPPNIRSVGKEANNSFRSRHWDEIEMALVTLHPDTGREIPGIADRWSIGQDGQSVYFHIDKEARWSDGKKITSRDFLMTFYVYLSPYLTGSFYREYFGEQFWGVTTYGDDYLCIRIAFPKPMAAYSAAIIPFQEDFYSEFGPDFESRYNWRPRPTAGAYVIQEKDIVKGRSISMTRVKDWWARDRKYYRHRFNADRIEYALVRDEEKIFQLFLRGDIDTYLFTDATRWYEKSEVPEVFNGYIEKATFYNEYPAITRGLYMNQSVPLLADQNIRIGLQHATNWDKIIKVDLRGDAERMNIFAEGYGDISNPAIRAREFSPELARQFFAKAGFTTTGPDGILVNSEGQRLSFAVNFARVPALIPITLRLKEEAARAGVEYRLEPMDAVASFQKVSRKEHEIAFAGWGSQPPQPDYFQYFHSSEAYIAGTRRPKPASNNATCFADPAVDPLLEANRNARSMEEVRDTSHRIEEILHERAVWIPGYYRPFYRAGYWRWVRWPSDFNVRLGDEAEMNYVYWIDNDLKEETLEARRTGRSFPEKSVIYDKYRKKTAASR